LGLPLDEDCEAQPAPVAALDADQRMALSGAPNPDTIATPLLKKGRKSVAGAIRAEIDGFGILPKRFQVQFQRVATLL
jgi:hypothetical protein